MLSKLGSGQIGVSPQSVDQAVYPSQGGVSLLELLISMAIVGFLATASWRYFNVWQDNQLVFGQMHRLIVVIRNTRAQAMRQNTALMLCPYAATALCGEQWSLGMNVINQSIGQVVKRFPIEKAVVLNWRSSLGNHHKLSFLPTGFTNGQQGSFYVCRHQVGYRVIITLSGRLRWVKLEGLAMCHHP